MTMRTRPAIAEVINPAFRTVFAAGINPWTNETMPAAAPSSTAHLGSNPFTSHGYPAAEPKSAKLAAVPAPARTSTPTADGTKKRKNGPAPGTLCRGRVDMAALKIEKDVPLPTTVTTSSYAELFSRMEPKDCITCKPGEVVSIANAMRKWLRDERKIDVLQVVSEKNSPKNPEFGHVWMWPKSDFKALPPKSRGGVVLGRLRAKAAA